MSWPATNINSDGSLVPFTTAQIKALKLSTAGVKDGSHPTLRLDPQGCSVNRDWFCDGTQRDNAVAYMLGAVALTGTAPNYGLSRIMPQVFPDPGYEQYAALAAEDVRGARSCGIDSVPDQVPRYKSAKLAMRYEQVFWNLAADGAGAEYSRYVEQLPSTVESSVLSLPGSMMKFFRAGGGVPDGIPIPYNVGRVETLTRVAYKWHRLPYRAWIPGSPLYNRVHGDPSNITVVFVPGAPVGFGKTVGLPYIGCVSSAAMLGYPSGFAMLEGVEEQQVPDPVSGFLSWNLIYKFLIKNTANSTDTDGGHNYLFYGGTGGDGVKAGYYFTGKGARLFFNGAIPDGVCLYNERNLLNLWNVGAVPDANI